MSVTEQRQGCSRSLGPLGGQGVSSGAGQVKNSSLMLRPPDLPNLLPWSGHSALLLKTVLPHPLPGVEAPPSERWAWVTRNRPGWLLPACVAQGAPSLLKKAPASLAGSRWQGLKKQAGTCQKRNRHTLCYPLSQGRQLVKMPEGWPAEGHGWEPSIPRPLREISGYIPLTWSRKEASCAD